MIFRLPNVDGMLISVFSIDIIMAAEYIARAGSVAPHGRIPIAVTKLLGDLFAWLCYARYSVFVAAVGFVVLLLNLFYLSYSLEYVSQRMGERREKRR
ncbi:MAG: hypothetical protein LUH51_04350 [Firmicutes bacterium]|nr:hypothetical protein [Bacillota bacterium]